VLRRCKIHSDAALLGLDLVGEIGDGAKGNWAGAFVAISGDNMIVAVGAAKKDDYAIDSGHVKIYKWDDGLLNYKQLGETITGEEGGDNFSEVSLSSDGKTLAIGGRYNDANGSYSGHVKVFSLEDHHWSWKQVG